MITPAQAKEHEAERLKRTKGRLEQEIDRQIADRFVNGKRLQVSVIGDPECVWSLAVQYAGDGWDIEVCRYPDGLTFLTFSEAAACPGKVTNV